MNSKIINTLLLIFFLNGMYGQQMDSNALFGTNKMVFYSKSKTPDGYTGSPFLTENFKSGIMRDDKGKTMKGFFRYDAVEDVVQVKINKDDSKSYVLPKLKSIIYELDNYSIFIDQFQDEKGKAINGYMLDYYSKNNLRFLARPNPDIIPAKPAKTGYDKDKPAHLDIDIVYYVQKDGGRLNEVRLKAKDFKDLFSDKSKMESYFKENKIKDEQDVVAMLEFYAE